MKKYTLFDILLVLVAIALFTLPDHSTIKVTITEKFIVIGACALIGYIFINFLNKKQ